MGRSNALVLVEAICLPTIFSCVSHKQTENTPKGKQTKLFCPPKTHSDSHSESEEGSRKNTQTRKTFDCCVEHKTALDAGVSGGSKVNSYTASLFVLSRP